MQKYIDVSTSLLTPFIAFVTLYIAYRQYKVDRDNVKHALYERRYNVYINSRNYLKYIISADELDRTKNEKFIVIKGESEFLFKYDISEFLQLIYFKAMVLECCRQKLYYDNDSQVKIITNYVKDLGLYEYVVEDRFEELQEIICIQLMNDSGSIRERFNPYLNFKNY